MSFFALTVREKRITRLKLGLFERKEEDNVYFAFEDIGGEVRRMLSLFFFLLETICEK